MRNLDTLTKQLEFAKRPMLYQVLSLPILALKFFILTRIAKITSIPITWKARTFWGASVEGNFPDPSFASIYLFGFLDEAVTKMLIKYLKPGMIFVDIGAHIGYESLLAAEVVGKKGKIFSFEPTPATYSQLVRNLSGYTNVVTNNIAVWSKSTLLEFIDYGASFSGLNSVTYPRTSPAYARQLKPRTINVSALTLDDYLGLYKIKPDFIKIDAESAEYDILIGMKHTLAAGRPILVVEIGDRPEQKGRSERLIKFLTDRGYQALEYKSGRFTPHIQKDSYLSLYDNLLFLPL